MREEIVNAEEAAERRIRTGIVLSLLGVMGLSLGTDLPLGETLGLPALLLLLPAVSLAQLPLLGNQSLERIPVYLGSMAMISTLGSLGFLLGLRMGGPAALGLRSLPLGEFLAWTAGLTLTGLLLVLLSRTKGSDPEEDFVDRLLPRTRSERWSFVALSGVAGIGEEVAYRGYAIAALQLLPIGPWSAAVVTSAAFGLLHAYQGAWGVVRTGAIGLAFAAGLLFTGSLLPAIAAHTLVDLIAGLVVGPRRPPLDPTPSVG